MEEGGRDRRMAEWATGAGGSGRSALRYTPLEVCEVTERRH